MHVRERFVIAVAGMHGATHGLAVSSPRWLAVLCR
jgi:hypothetical protein